MKTIILSGLLLSTVNAFAFGVNLQEQGVMTVDNLVEIGADYVQCEQQHPRCIIQGKSYGIQYPGQKLGEVHLQEMSSADYALVQVKQLKREGLCK